MTWQNLKCSNKINVNGDVLSDWIWRLKHRAPIQRVLKMKWGVADRVETDMQIYHITFKSRSCGPLTCTYRQTCLQLAFPTSCSTDYSCCNVHTNNRTVLVCAVSSGLFLGRASCRLGWVGLFAPRSFAACKFAMTVFHSSIPVYVGSPVVGVRAKEETSGRGRRLCATSTAEHVTGIHHHGTRRRGK